MTTKSGSEPVIVVSNDSHIGPRLVADMRSYCPAEHLEEFDRQAEQQSQMMGAFEMMAKDGGGGHFGMIARHQNMRTLGHYDSDARLADYDYDGVAAGVIFHGSLNMEPIPFVGLGGPVGDATDSKELLGVGQNIYNQWLADFCSQAPDRHIGLMYLPMWDVDAAVKEVERWHDAGLRGVNFPAPRDGELMEYNRREWDPLWAVCAERGLPLVTHVGGGSQANISGPEFGCLLQMETGGWFSRRAIWWMIWGGVFERYPDLKLVVTETPGNWYIPLGHELDAIHGTHVRRPDLNAEYLKQVPKPPSEYMATNVYFGASFTSRYEAEQAILNGLESQLMWGSDYPHIEGTFLNPEGTDMPSVTRLAMRNTFCEIPAEHTKRMLGENAIEVYRLDREKLQKIAEQIDAPTLDDLAKPIDLDLLPEDASTFAFRSGDSGWS